MWTLFRVSDLQIWYQHEDYNKVQVKRDRILQRWSSSSYKKRKKYKDSFDFAIEFVDIPAQQWIMWKQLQRKNYCKSESATG